MQSQTLQNLNFKTPSVVGKLSAADETELRLLCAEIEYRRAVNPLQFFQYLPSSQRFADDPSKTKILFGGNRSSKTMSCSAYVLQKALAKKMRIWAVAETFSDSVNIQQRKIWELLPKNQISYGNYDDINGFCNRKLRLKNKSIIKFCSYDQGREAFQGDDCDLIWFDEEPPLEIWRECRMRLIDRDGEMVLSMTATKGITDLISDIFEDCDVEETRYAEYVKKDLPVCASKNGMKFFMLWTTDNHYIDQSRFREELKLMSADEILSRGYGIPVNLSGRIYPAFNKSVHVIDYDFVPNDNICLYNILDPHDRKPFALIWVAVHKTGTAYQIDEYPNVNFNDVLSDDKTYDMYRDIIKEKEKALKDMYGVDVIKRIIDPNFGNKAVRLAESSDRKAHTTPKEEMAKRGFRYVDGIDALEAGHLKVREALHYEKTGDEITKQPRYFITDNCVNTIRHLSRYSRKDLTTADGDTKDKPGVQEKYKDFCDCVRYFWMSNPRYIGDLKTYKPESQKVY